MCRKPLLGLDLPPPSRCIKPDMSSGRVRRGDERGAPGQLANLRLGLASAFAHAKAPPGAPTGLVVSNEMSGQLLMISSRACWLLAMPPTV